MDMAEGKSETVIVLRDITEAFEGNFKRTGPDFFIPDYSKTAAEW